MWCKTFFFIFGFMNISLRALSIKKSSVVYCLVALKSEAFNRLTCQTKTSPKQLKASELKKTRTLLPAFVLRAIKNEKENRGLKRQ